MIVSRPNCEVSNISDLEIPPHDKRILEILSIKYQKLAETQEISHNRHIEWQQELKNMEYERNNRNNEWKKIVFRKPCLFDDEGMSQFAMRIH